VLEKRSLLLGKSSDNGWICSSYYKKLCCRLKSFKQSVTERSENSISTESLSKGTCVPAKGVSSMHTEMVQLKPQY
jgi:hypothetical protein